MLMARGIIRTICGHIIHFGRMDSPSPLLGLPAELLENAFYHLVFPFVIIACHKGAHQSGRGHAAQHLPLFNQQCLRTVSCGRHRRAEPGRSAPDYEDFRINCTLYLFYIFHISHPALSKIYNYHAKYR